MIPALAPTGFIRTPTSFLVSTGAKSSNTTTVTTTGIDTSTATLIVVGVGSYEGNPANVVSDSKGNGWTPLTPQSNVGNDYHRLWYSVPTTVGGSHTFDARAASGACYPAICVCAFKNTRASLPFDTSNGTTKTGSFTTFQPGSITPEVAGSLIIFGWGSYFNLTGPPTCDSGLTSPFQVREDYSAGFNFSSFLTWGVQSSTSAINPTASFGVSSGNGFASGSVASFKPA